MISKVENLLNTQSCFGGTYIGMGIEFWTDFKFSHL